MFLKNGCTLISTHNFGRKNEGKVISIRLKGEAACFFGGTHLQCSFFWHNAQVRVKSLVSVLKADILPRNRGKCMIWVTGRFQMEGLHSAPPGYECLLETVWAHSLGCLHRCVQCARLYLLLREVLTQEEKKVTWRGPFGFSLIWLWNL